MAKPKKKRAKKYDPRKHHIAYLDILDISANKGLSEAARIYVSNHHLMPVRRAQEKGLSA